MCQELDLNSIVIFSSHTKGFLMHNLSDCIFFYQPLLSSLFPLFKNKMSVFFLVTELCNLKIEADFYVGKTDRHLL